MNESSLQTNSSIYVELDALMDTRLGALYQLNPALAMSYLVDGFGQRTRDQFEKDGQKVSFEEFKAFYDKRDKTVLTNASVTPVLDMIQSYVRTSLKTTANSPIQTKPRIWINVYPYVLEDSEKQLIAKAVYRSTTEAADVLFMDSPPAGITPKFFNEEVTIAIMYRPDLWLEEHCSTELILKETCPSVSLYGPRMSFVDRVDDPSVDDFDIYMRAAAPLINLMLLPVRYFSSVLVGRFKKKT